jgi:hypothetical protein
MGCPSEVEIGASLVFSICTHDPDTGVLTDADAAPSYRVYEDETAVAILTGNMAKLDDANTTGFYTESIACTAANGFENGKTYTIYIGATVDSDTGGISYGFKAYDVRLADSIRISGSSEAADNLEASAETIVVAAAAAGTLSTTQMTTNLTEATDDHYNGRIIIWTSGNLQDQATDITDYDGASKMLTFTAVTEAPVAADAFIIV